MTAVWYNTNDDRIVIDGALQTYAPRTLRAVFNDAGQIMVRLKIRNTNEYGPFPYTELTDGQGQGFADRMEAMVYLNSVFGRRPAAYGIERVQASEDLGGQRVVRLTGVGQVGYASSDNPAHALYVLGLTQAAATAGSRVNVLTQGFVEDPAWNWAPGPLYLGTSGLMVPSAPTVGFVQHVATAVTATRILLVKDEPYLLAS